MIFGKSVSNLPMKKKQCPYCHSEMVVVGFERKLITRGKDKGLSTVRDLLGCSNKDCKKLN